MMAGDNITNWLDVCVSTGNVAVRGVAQEALDELGRLRDLEARAREMDESWSSTEPSAQAAGVAHYIRFGES
jgi:hypothetical protein